MIAIGFFMLAISRGWLFMSRDEEMGRIDVVACVAAIVGFILCVTGIALWLWRVAP